MGIWSIFSEEPSKQKRTSANVYRTVVEGPASAVIGKQMELMQQGHRIRHVHENYNIPDPSQRRKKRG